MKKDKIKYIVTILITIYSVVFFSMIVDTYLNTQKNNTTSSYAKKIKNVTINIGGKKNKCTLPFEVKDLNPRQIVEVSFNLKTKGPKHLYVKSVYAPFKVFSNNELIYNYTQNLGPKFMKDPATKVDIVTVPHNKETTTIKIIYYAPIDRASLMIHPFIYGDYSSIRNDLLNEMFFTVFIATASLLIGIFLILIGRIYRQFETKSTSFVWIGLFSLLTGLFSLAECNLTQLYLKNEAILYIIDFCCFFTLPIPIIEFCKSLIDFKNKKALIIAQFIQGITATICLFLQVFSLVPLYKTLYIFIILSPIILLFLATSIIREFVIGNTQAKAFISPILIVAISAIIEAVNYKFRFLTTLSSCFMIGVLIFTILISINCSIYISSLIKLKEKNTLLLHDMQLLEKQILTQKSKNDLVLKNMDQLRIQRHDLRHQLAVIARYNKEGKSKKLDKYISSLIDAIPTETSMNYCENQAVNAIIIYYLNQLKDPATKIEIKLSIPDNLISIKDNDLCIVIGNLLENAVEACNKLKNKQKKFITLYSRIQYDTLTITLDNSFNGIYQLENDSFISSKRNEYGIGINSVKNIVKKYDGNCKFETKDNTFMSSIYLKF